VESAAYFAVSELLANVSKHARADRVWIDIRYDGATNGGGILKIGVTPTRVAAVPIRPAAPGCAASSAVCMTTRVTAP
jgi:hypothetical protein